MEAPDKIYQCRFAAGEYDVAYRLTPHPYAENTEYIRKDLLLEWAKELTSEPYDRTTVSALKHQIAYYLLEKLNSL